MSDLISRLSLKDRASEYALSADEYLRFCEIIDAEPTAYDIDKVVDELDNTSHWTESSFDEDGYSNDDSEEVVYLNKAIEIVKQGCVETDDVCEWRIDDDDQWHTGCRNKIDNMDNEVNTIEDYIEHTRFSYCPFCRKKIKVVDLYDD